MPKTKLWPGGIAIEPLKNVDSAGSCDSMDSCSASSTIDITDDSLQHLSAEERACLMFLEETIEALDAEDSGLSNDEMDPGQVTPKMGRASPALHQTTINDGPHFQHDSERDQKPFLNYGVPTPLLLLTNGTPSFPARATGISDLKMPEAATDSSVARTELSVPNQPSEPHTSEVAKNSEVPELTINTEQLQIPKDISIQSEAPVNQKASSNSDSETVAESKTLSPASMLDLATNVTDGDEVSKSVPALPVSQVGPAIVMENNFIPPPSDFSDEPPPESLPEKEKDPPDIPGSSSKSPNTLSALDFLSQNAYTRKAPLSSPKPKEVETQIPAEVLVHTNPPIPSETLSTPPFEVEEPRSPPAVAPKPKKLPSNIILKPSRPSEGNSGHSVPSASDRALLDPQRVHMEALRKLGLLKSDETEQGPTPSSKLSPRSRKSWAAPSPPISPAVPITPSNLSIPSPTLVISPPPATFQDSAPYPANAPPPSTAMSPDILPAPADFSDPEPLSSHGALHPAEQLSEPVNVQAQSDTPPRTSPVPPKHLTPPKSRGIKAATLERSGMGLSSDMESQESTYQDNGTKSSLNVLRNTRPRPASLGSGKDFVIDQQGGLLNSKDDDTRRSMPVSVGPQQAGDSQKLPRAHGISVMICPRSQNREDRREALKKLGLIRD